MERQPKTERIYIYPVGWAEVWPDGPENAFEACDECAETLKLVWNEEDLKAMRFSNYNPLQNT